MTVVLSGSGNSVTETVVGLGGEKPADIADKCRAIFDYEAAEKEPVRCDLCGNDNPIRTKMRDRYGFSVVLAECEDCGLLFLSPRMRWDGYERFYEGAYRNLVSVFHGREINADTIRGEQYTYGLRLSKVLKRVKPLPDRTPSPADRLTLLDIGGSTGMVAAALGREWYRASILDPSPVELKVAGRWGFEAMLGTVEAYDAGNRRWDLITMCQTADHLLNPLRALEKVRKWLAPDGIFWVDIVDFDVTREVKIDHPFNFTDKTARAMLAKAGFEIVHSERAPDGVHVGYVCK